MKVKIPLDEFKERIVKTQKAMKEDNLDLLLCYGNEAEPQFVRYYSNYWPSFESAGVLIPAEGEPVLIIGPESGTFSRDVSKITNIKKLLSFRESSEPEYPGAKLDNFDSIIREVMGSRPLRRFGLAGYSLITKVIFDDIKSSLRNFGINEVLKADLLVSKIRAVKSENEIQCMKEAYRICQAAMKKVVESIHVGMTENQIKGIALETIYNEGGEGEAYPFWILAGSKTNQAISRCRGNQISPGDMIQIQVGARYEGYASTMGRAVVAGKATDEQKEMIEAALAAQRAVLDHVKAGVNAAEISRIHESVLKEKGYEKCILYGPCHGTGLMEGEYPWIESNSDFLLEENMTFATCIYLGDDDKKVGIRIEDGYRVTKDGAESFSDYRREVIEV